jgi:hypothetical protein
VTGDEQSLRQCYHDILGFKYQNRLVSFARGLIGRVPNIASIIFVSSNGLQQRALLIFAFSGSNNAVGRRPKVFLGSQFFKLRLGFKTPQKSES